MKHSLSYLSGGHFRMMSREDVFWMVPLRRARSSMMEDDGFAMVVRYYSVNSRRDVRYYFLKYDDYSNIVETYKNIPFPPFHAHAACDGSSNPT
jgi:hypothetical protein